MLQVSSLMYRLHDDSDADEGSDLEPDCDEGKSIDCLVAYMQQRYSESMC